ncbi:hypothetical protein I6F34_01405 [Bradyrhizobium sp. BRP05]|nr:hypothetical protein [Bradyrhizobium sp. BRP05]
MTEEQLAFLTRVTELPRMIGPDQGPDRTLLYGYDCDRATWHIYQKDGELHRVIYRPSDLDSRTKPEVHDHGPALDAETLSPNKRLYPEACDFDFCAKLKALGVHLSFTTYGTLFDRDRRHPFVGRTF